MTLEEKVKKAKEVIKQVAGKYKPQQIAVAWTGGKDSTVILHLVKQTFNNKIPFRVMFNDSTIEFPEVYDFIKRLKKDWSLDLLWVKHFQEDLEEYQKIMENQEIDKKQKEQGMEIMRIAKINAINYALSEYSLKAFLSGIRWDEHQARSKEKYFSLRSNHLRVHPILHFTLDDIWKYIRLYNVPYVSLYDQGYKSLGEAPFTNPVDDPDADERAGREATKEKAMERLRDLGYW